MVLEMSFNLSTYAPSILDSRLFTGSNLQMIANFLVSMRSAFSDFSDLSLEIGYRQVVPSVVSNTSRKGLKVRPIPNFITRTNRIKQCCRGRGNKDRGSHQTRVS